VLGRVTEVLDESIAGVGMPAQPVPVIDLSRIDFEALRARFQKSRNTRTPTWKPSRPRSGPVGPVDPDEPDPRQLRGEIRGTDRVYNAGQPQHRGAVRGTAQAQRSLNEEQDRHVREQLSEEELVIFDILTRPAPELTPEERAEVKKVARDLLARLKALLVLNWRQKSAARSQLRLAIEDVLDQPACPAPTQTVVRAEVLRPVRACVRELCGAETRGCMGEFATVTVCVSRNKVRLLPPAILDQPAIQPHRIRQFRR
jgi:type I restriction enzyme R subunit